MEHVRSNVHGLALDLIRPASIVPDGSGHSSNITTGHRDGLAIVQGLDGGEKIKVLLDKIGKPEKVDTPLLRRGCPPFALEGFARSSDSNVNILLGSFRYVADNLLGGRVNNLKGLLVNGLNPLVVNPPAR